MRHYVIVPAGAGCYPQVPGPGISQLARQDGIDAVLVTPWRWDGRERMAAGRPLTRTVTLGGATDEQRRALARLTGRVRGPSPEHAGPANRRSPGARDIGGALYPDLADVEWIPSDDADVFRLSFTSDREPRILKMATHGIRAVWREIGAFPAMRRLGVPEVLEFEHTSDDLPDRGIDFHVTLELEILLRFGAADPAPLVERFLAGWVPAGQDQSRLEELRLWWTHGILWWAGLNLSMGADPDADLTGVYAAARHALENDDPVSWLSRDAAAATP